MMGLSCYTIYSGNCASNYNFKLATDESLITKYPSLSKPAIIMLIYSVSTFEVERGFSYQNAVKINFVIG